MATPADPAVHYQQPLQVQQEPANGASSLARMPHGLANIHINTSFPPYSSLPSSGPSSATSPTSASGPYAHAGGTSDYQRPFYHESGQSTSIPPAAQAYGYESHQQHPYHQHSLSPLEAHPPQPANGAGPFHSQPAVNAAGALGQQQLQHHQPAEPAQTSHGYVDHRHPTAGQPHSSTSAESSAQAAQHHPTQPGSGPVPAAYLRHQHSASVPTFPNSALHHPQQYHHPQHQEPSHHSVPSLSQSSSSSSLHGSSLPALDLAGTSAPAVSNPSASYSGGRFDANLRSGIGIQEGASEHTLEQPTQNHHQPRQGHDPIYQSHQGYPSGGPGALPAAQGSAPASPNGSRRQSSTDEHRRLASTSGQSLDGMATYPVGSVEQAGENVRQTGLGLLHTRASFESNHSLGHGDPSPHAQSMQTADPSSSTDPRAHETTAKMHRGVSAVSRPATIYSELGGYPPASAPHTYQPHQEVYGPRYAPQLSSAYSSAPDAGQASYPPYQLYDASSSTPTTSTSYPPSTSYALPHPPLPPGHTAYRYAASSQAAGQAHNEIYPYPGSQPVSIQHFPPPPPVPAHHLQHPHSQRYAQPTSATGLISVVKCFPVMGPVNTPVALSIAIAPHHPHFIRGFRVMYGEHGTTTRVLMERRVAEGERVDLTATTPTLEAVYGHRTPTSSIVPLSLQALDEGGNVADWIELGTFEYTDVVAASHSNSSSSISSQLQGRPGQKRAGSPLSSARESPNNVSRATFASPESPFTDHAGNRLSMSSSSSAGPHRRGHSRGSSIGSLVNGFGHMSHHSRTSSLASVADSADPATLWMSGPDGELIERKPIARLRAPTTQPTSTPSSSSLRHPPIEEHPSGAPALYRTSQMPLAPDVSPPLGFGSPSSSSVVSANKANLRFEGDLNMMAVGWTHDEWLVKRRLVQFWRKQEGNTITATFRPVTLQELTSTSIVISCIFREEKNECFVTSVDTIYLLEALVAVRFTVEEKNRIRRNLEGFKPITVSKSKADSEEFFKLIMGFPNPKPRNIEKDVKVFPWKTLSTALRKIIGKYSASYINPDEVGSMGKPGPQSIGWPAGQTPPVQQSSLPQQSQGGVSSAPSYLPSRASDDKATPAQRHSDGSEATTMPTDLERRLPAGRIGYYHQHSHSSESSFSDSVGDTSAASSSGTAVPYDTTASPGKLPASSSDVDSESFTAHGLATNPSSAVHGNFASFRYP